MTPNPQSHSSPARPPVLVPYLAHAVPRRGLKMPLDALRETMRIGGGYRIPGAAESASAMGQLIQSTYPGLLIIGIKSMSDIQRARSASLAYEGEPCECNWCFADAEDAGESIPAEAREEGFLCQLCPRDKQRLKADLACVHRFILDCVSRTIYWQVRGAQTSPIAATVDMDSVFKINPAANQIELNSAYFNQPVLGAMEQTNTAVRARVVVYQHCAVAATNRYASSAAS